jgi:hypothetical protein
MQILSLLTLALAGQVSRSGKPQNLATIAFLVSLWSVPTVLAQSAHEHGVAELNLVREGQVVQIEFSSPGANLLGFERMPATSEEWMLLATVAEDLETAIWLLGEQLDGCDMRIEAMEIPSFSAGAGGHDGHDHGVAHEDHEDHDEAEHIDHVDFRVQYTFECAGSLPSQLVITAFASFPAIERINTQLIIAGRPGFNELTVNASALSLE